MGYNPVSIVLYLDNKKYITDNVKPYIINKADIGLMLTI
jgi:hypothetical protein